jgi:uncharacterized protein (TIGR02996 family)
MASPNLADLIGAIRAAPDDAAPRLVLADALIQRGDPRGELIHVQHALAVRPAAPELVKREKALCAQLPASETWISIAWVGGFATATVSAHQAARGIELLTDEPWIDRLKIDGCAGGGDERWTGVGALIAATMDRLGVLELGGVVWYWYDSDHEDREEIDESAACTAMFGRLPPRPPGLRLLLQNTGLTDSVWPLADLHEFDVVRA